MAWNDTHNQTTDWSAVAFLNMFVDAIKERDRAMSNSGSSAAAVTVVAADDVSAAGFIADLQIAIEGLMAGLVWVSKRYWNGSSYSTISDYHGKPALQFWTFAPGGGSEPNICGTILNVDGWTRKYPREINTLADTTYTDGSAFANGHKARNRADAKIYDRTAGAWGLNTTDRTPDTLTDYGNIAAGDYIGPWLWNEMRDVLNALDWLEASIDTETAAEFINADATDQASESAAKTAAESDYSGQSPTPTSPPSAAYGSTEMVDSGAGQFDAFIETGRVELNASGIQVQYSSVVDFYAFSTDYGSSATNEYDAMDLNLVDDALGKFAASVAVDGSGVSDSVWLGTMTLPPRWPTYSSPSASRGWLVGNGDWTALVRCTGFAYKA